MASATPEPVALAILAKAPTAGSVKTRLIPALGADGAAALHARLIERTVETVQRLRAMSPFWELAQEGRDQKSGRASP